MEQVRQINATLTNDELQQIDEGKQREAKQPEGKKVDKAEIINLISQLPIKERLDLIRDLQNAAGADANSFSLGQEGNTSHYDTLRDGYQKKAKEADEKQLEETK
jgi:hypothetical protein